MKFINGWIFNLILVTLLTSSLSNFAYSAENSDRKQEQTIKTPTVQSIPQETPTQTNKTNQNPQDSTKKSEPPKRVPAFWFILPERKM